MLIKKMYDFKDGLSGQPELAAILDDWNAAAVKAQSDEFMKDVAYAISENTDREPLEVAEALISEMAAPLDKARKQFQPDAPSIAPWLGQMFLRHCNSIASDCEDACRKDSLLHGMQSIIRDSSAFGDMTALLRVLGKSPSPYAFDEHGAAERYSCYIFRDMHHLSYPVLNYEQLNTVLNMISSSISRLSLPATDWELNSAFIAVQNKGIIKNALKVTSEAKCDYLSHFVDRFCRIYKTMSRTPPFLKSKNAGYEQRMTNRFLSTLAEAAKRDEPTLQECMVAQMNEDAFTIMEQIARKASGTTKYFEAAVAERRAEIGFSPKEEDVVWPRP